MMTYTHGTYNNSKRTLQARRLPKNVVIGIILALIAVIATAVAILLLFRLKRLWRLDRRAEKQVDLLGSEAGDLSIPAGGSEEVFKERLWDKPLPPIPSAGPMGSYAMVPGNGYVPMDGEVDVGPSSQILSRPGDRGTSDSDFRLSLNLPLSHLNIPMPRLPTKPAHTRTSSISSIGNRAYNNNFSSGMPQTSNSISRITRGQLTIANATDADYILVGRSQSLRHNLPPYSQIRGRDAPFPAAALPRPRPKQLRSILKPSKADAGKGMSSYATTSEKQAMMDARSSTTSYMVQIPIPRISRTPASPLQSQRARTPLTLTTSRPVSNVVIESADPVRQPNGSRMVTMSVLVDDSDNSGSEYGGGGRYSYPNRNGTGRSSLESQYVVGEVLERYATDLPPYTPIHEDCSVPQ